MSIPEMSQSMKYLLAVVVAATAVLAIPADAEAQMGGPALVRVAVASVKDITAVTQLEQTRSDRDVARGDLEVTRARLEQNENQLARTAIRAPLDALVLRPDGQSVFVVDRENLARQVSVTVGVGNGDDIDVLGELAPGDRVVIRGNERLQQGQAVDIMDT